MNNKQVEINFSCDNGANNSDFGIHIQIKKRGAGVPKLTVRGGDATRWFKGMETPITTKEANFIMYDAISFDEILPILIKHTH